MIREHASLDALWTAALVEELIRWGITSFCVAPGSRSTPLVAAIARDPRAACHVHFDERGAAFHALGYGRACPDKPAVLVSTSGTAAVEFAPAVVEAAEDNVPLIVLTADRPPELRSAGANQTIDQVKLYGAAPRWFFDCPCPDPAIPLEVVLTTIDHAVDRATAVPAGPVHLNCMFREPFVPPGPPRDFSACLSGVAGWLAGDKPYTRYEHGVSSCEPVVVAETAARLEQVEQGVVVVGRGAGSDVREAALVIGVRLKWPVLPDIGSGVRTGPAAALFTPYHDQLLASASFAADQSPGAVVHLGGAVTSKRLQEWLRAARCETYVLVAETPERRDPNHRVTQRFCCGVRKFAQSLVEHLGERGATAWSARWERANATAARVLALALDAPERISEPFVARAISRHIAPGSCLFLGNSMPVRDMDMYAVSDGPAIRVAGNRGTSGIDGTVAAAAGFVRGAATRGTVLLGDLALLHDLNSLALLSSLSVPLTVVVINNDGGGIFSFLPIADQADIFEPCWGTPHGISFKAAADLFEVSYAEPVGPEAFVEAYRAAQESDTATRIEVRTDRAKNVRLHRALLEKVTTAVDATS